MDNYYTSPALCKELVSLGFDVCGTVRPDRKGMPEGWRISRKRKHDLPETMKKGDLRTQDLGSGITAVQWKDKRLVTLLGSTQHGTSMLTKQRRNKSVE